MTIDNLSKVMDSLSPNERKILPYLQEKNVSDIAKKSNLDKVSVTRALAYLENKKIIELRYLKRKIVDVGVNGALYRKKGLPERRLLNTLNEKRIIHLKDLQKEASLTEEEAKASLGALKKKAMIEIKNEKIVLSASKEEISKKTLEEQFIESLPLEYESLSDEQKHALKNLESRKNILEILEEKQTEIIITEFGKKIISTKVKDQNFIETITPDMIQKEAWKGKRFRRYDVLSPVPVMSGGKRHFVNQATDYARKVWTEMGFQEMDGNMLISSFWNFDALFTPQDHSARELQDTFFINKKIELPENKIVNAVKKAHETGIPGSKGWNYSWNEEEAKRLVLRTHTTCLSAQTLSKININELPKKFFAVGKCFRNETIDWNHGFEFNQTEGIVIDENANFSHLLGYLKKFAEKMGFEKVRFRPHYFPYTEPSLEGDVWNEERQEWVEIFAAGIFRPEVTQPLLGKPIPVLAWGPGFDRMIMKVLGIKDLREMYKNNINTLRKTKFFIK